MISVMGNYTDKCGFKKTFSGDFRDIDTKSKTLDYEIICRNQSTPDSSGLRLVLISTADIYNEMVKILSKNPVIEKIFIIREENTFYIWTALSQYDKNARYSLYNSELEIIKHFASVEFHFDFHLAEPDDVEELLSSGAKIIYTKSKP